jgi:TRAP-type C4-dicarboxylate transport system permease small subunit
LDRVLNRVERVIKFLGSLLDRITHLTWLLAGALIVLMSFVVGYGVFTRYVLKNPDPYTYDITCIIMLVCVVFTFAHTQRLDRHLRIDLMDRYFPESVRGILHNIVTPIVGLVFCGVLTWKSWEDAWLALQGSQVTRGVLVIPTFPIKITVTIGAGLLCLVLIAQMLRYLASLRIKGKTVRE